MSTVELTAENFDEVIGGADDQNFVFIDFWAGWCGPCVRFAPVYEKAAERHSDIVFAKVDTEAQRELAAAFDIQSIPTLAIIRDGTLVFSQAGALPAPGTRPGPPSACRDPARPCSDPGGQPVQQQPEGQFEAALVQPAAPRGRLRQRLGQ
ncbi:thioredoxin family protein [Kitasatospora sp. P5_F3]